MFATGGFIRSLVYAAQNPYAPNSFFLSGGSGSLVVCVSRVLLRLCFSLSHSHAAHNPNATNSTLLSSGLFPTGGLGLSRSASVVCYSARVSCPSYRARLSLSLFLLLPWTLPVWSYSGLTELPAGVSSSAPTISFPVWGIPPAPARTCACSGHVFPNPYSSVCIRVTATLLVTGRGGAN